MEPLSIILTAILAGVTAGFKDTASQAVKDSYTQLKGLLLKKLEEKKSDTNLLEKLEETTIRKEDEGRIKDLIARNSIDKDEDILDAAKNFLVLTQNNVVSSKYNISIQNSKGIIVGDDTTNTQIFNENDQS